VSKGALAMVVALGIACRGEGVAENTGGGAAVEVTTQALTAVDIDRVLGFEGATVSDWSIIQSGPGTLSVSTTASQGSHSLAVGSHGYVPVQSVALPSLGSRVGSVIHYDIMLPSQLKQVSPNNYGATQFYLNSPSLGLNNTYLGQVNLTPLPVGQWSTLTFTPSSSVLTKLRGTYTDLRVTIVVNAPYNATQPYLLDNLRLSDSTLALITVVDGGGHPISGLTVTAYNGSTPTSNTGVTDSTGLAKVWVPPGSYRFGVTEAGVTTYSSVANLCQVPGICVAATIIAKCHSVVCAAKDQCHSVGTCDPGAGLCSNPNKAYGTACSDGNACTKNDVCTAGVCGGTPYTCNDGLACTADSCNGDGTCTFSVTAEDCLIGGACYAGGAGSSTNQCQQCTPTTSQTAWSAKTNGTACNDGNACTKNDVCTAGTCGGTAYTCNDGLSCTVDTCNGDGTCSFALSPGNCLISGVCYAAGAISPVNQCQQCTPISSQTGWTPRTDGTGCNDGNACTGNDKCTAGTCGGTAYSCDDGLACTADVCNGDGTCTHTTAAGNCLIGGTCYAAGAGSPINQCQQCTPATSQTAWSAKTNGTSCNDGNACTQTDTCSAGTCTGSNPVRCTASDQCHDVGSCDPATGACSNPARVDGTNCNDGNACTQTDACLAGACAGGNPVQCTASDQCHSVGTCDPATGTCSNPAKVDGTSCNDGNACTQTDACVAGACAGGNPVQCTASDQCHSVGTCDPATGTCSNPAKPAGAACDDGLFCNGPDTCDTAGACSVHSGPACTKTPCDETTRSCLGTGNIGPAGGQIAYPDGASADFPAQAVTATTAISISVSQSGYPDLPAGAVLQGSVWEFEPHGATFAAAVTIRIPFTAGVAQPMLYTAEPGGTWQLVPGATVDGNTLQASVTAFSYMAPLTMTGGTTPPGACISLSAASFAASADFATLSGGLWSPMGVAVGDINGDGKPDLAVVENQYQSASKVAVFLNTTNPANGVPAFAARVDYDSGIDSRTDVALGDLDGDGKPDIVVGNEDGSFSALVNLTASGAATPSFAAKAVFPGKASGNRSVAVADVNRDSKLDVVGLSRNNNMTQIWLNTTAAGSGILSFSTAQTAYSGGGQPQSVAVADLNLDGKTDIVISNANPLDAQGSFAALVNLTTSGSTSPSFQMSAFTAGNLPARVAVADFNADGLPDVAVANNKSGTISIYLNTGVAGATVASFGAMQVMQLGSSASLALPTTVAAADLDGDGLPDLVVADGTANPSANRLEVFHNRTAAGSSTVSFSQPERLALSSASAGLAIADLTGDGKPEIIATTLDFGVSVFRNVASVSAGSSLSAKESQITDGTTSDQYPRLGADSQGLLVVYSVRPVSYSGYGPASITYQRLTSDGVPTGSPVLVSSGGTNDQLDDVSGNYIVYTAFDSVETLSGSIILYDIETATASVLATSYAFREARIFGNNVAWVQGGANAASVNLFDIRKLGTGAAPIVLAGPSPTALDPKLSDRFVVWDEMVSGQRDVYAYNLSTGAPTAVATSSTIDESLPATSGGWIVWVARDIGASTSRIEAANLDTGEKRTIANNGALNNRPSIDGNFVVYESNVGGNYDIYVYRMDAHDTFQVTTNASDEMFGEVFGSLVTYISGDNGNYQVFVSSMSPCP